MVVRKLKFKSRSRSRSRSRLELFLFEIENSQSHYFLPISPALALEHLREQFNTAGYDPGQRFGPILCCHHNTYYKLCVLTGILHEEKLQEYNDETLAAAGHFLTYRSPFSILPNVQETESF